MDQQSSEGATTAMKQILFKIALAVMAKRRIAEKGQFPTL
jgi:hypothetical protein